MNTLQSLFNSHFLQLAGWILLHSVWLGALIGLAFRLTDYFFRKASAQVRYSLACGALLFLCAAPFCTVLHGEFRPHAAGFPTGIVGRSQLQPIAAPADTALVSLAPSSQSVAGVLNKIVPLATIVWLAGVCISSMRMTRDWLQLRSLRLAATQPLPSDWLERLADLRCRLEITRPVLLMKSALVQVPTVIGWLRPIILFPAAAISDLSSDQLDAILAHELAHIRRNDFLVNLFQCLAETIFFYHPMVWWISNRIREERENCCDDLVINVCDDKLAYAQVLARLEESRATTPAFAFAATGGSLLNRIRRLLGVGAPEGRLSAAHACGMTLLLIGVIAIVVGTYLLIQAPVSYATARISYEMENHDGSSVPSNGFRTEPSQVFLQTQSELIRSPALLTTVSKELHLENLWAERLTNGKSVSQSHLLAELRRMIDVRHIPNTTLIDISVSSPDSNEAAKIANAIAAEYRRQQIQRYSERIETGILGLEESWAKQEHAIQAQRAKVEQLGQELGFTDEAASESITTPETQRRLAQLRIEKETQFMTEQTLLVALTNLPQTQLISVLPTTVPDPLLNSLTEQLNLAQQHLLALNADYGPNHTECLKVGAQISDLEKKINDRAQGILLGLQKRVDSLQQGLSRLKEDLDKAAATEAEQKRKFAPYAEAKRRLEELERFGQALSMKIASEKIESLQPKTVPQIIEPAVALQSTKTRSFAFPLIALGILLDALGLGLLRFARPGL